MPANQPLGTLMHVRPAGDSTGKAVMTEYFNSLHPTIAIDLLDDVITDLQAKRDALQQDQLEEDRRKKEERQAHSKD
jgi:hypothetical protein